jgi:diketogulonate reductase-like aldo/keto reductase
LSESVLALTRLQQEGKIRLIGLSNITVKQLEEARTIAQIAPVQNRYSVAERQGDAMVDYCGREGLAFVPYGPLGADPMRHGAPLASTQGTLADIGKQLGATATQVALSWLLHRAPKSFRSQGRPQLLIWQRMKLMSISAEEPRCHSAVERALNDLNLPIKAKIDWQRQA